MLILDRGEGAYLYDEAGNRFLDFGAGISVNALGHNRTDIVETIADQAQKLIHTSNLYAHRPGLQLAERLVASAPFPSEKPFAAVHFGNSGTEANEAAIKYARLYAHERRGRGHHKILSFSGGFHGRTMGALSATPKPKYKERFEPLVPGMVSLPFNDVAALEAALSPEFAAVIVEVVQGEGGLSVMTDEFAASLTELCAKHDVILIADEVQSGLGRTGALYASQPADLRADIITVAKPLAAGLPLSATMIPRKIDELLHVGDHGTTFGGGPVTTAVALKVLEIVDNPEFLAEVTRKGEYLRARLSDLASNAKIAGEVLGLGLLAGLSLGSADDSQTVGTVMQRCQDEGLLVLRSGTNALRLAPPLIVDDREIDEAIGIIGSVVQRITD
jgi:acetylornithine/N-succinyldiaminopimelate aminotransferase